MTPHLVRTFAKVNLSLLVYPPNDQGMHPIYSIFQNISLFDELEITESNTFQITCSNPNVPTNNLNLLSKIYSHFKNTLSTGFKIHLKKNIPMGGGLGGGSSNAAGFLQYLNKSQNWNFSQFVILRSAVFVGELVQSSSRPPCTVGFIAVNYSYGVMTRTCQNSE